MSSFVVWFSFSLKKRPWNKDWYSPKDYLWEIYEKKNYRNTKHYTIIIKFNSNTCLRVLCVGPEKKCQHFKHHRNPIFCFLCHSSVLRLPSLYCLVICIGCCRMPSWLILHLMDVNFHLVKHLKRFFFVCLPFET